MHPPPLPPKAQTTKQAKASFKARGSTTISHTEWKWLHREVELEERAEKLQEQEKRRAEAAKKKAAKEKMDRMEKERALIGTQRRLDRFGYKSSQLHLGKFFGRPGAAGQVKGAPDREPELEPMQEDDQSECEEFEDGDIDDESLLEALEQPVMRGEAEAERESETTMPVQHAMLPPALPPKSSDRVIRQHEAPAGAEHHAAATDEDLDAWWDDLESSTQIARELNGASISKPVSADRKDSFGSASFDLTLEDLDKLDPFKVNESVQPRGSVDAAHNSITTSTLNSAAAKAEQHPDSTTPHAMLPPAKTMAPPPLPASRLQPSRRAYQIQDSPFTSARQMHVRSVAPAAARFAVQTSLAQNLGFTSKQLEKLIDDDLQLTQDAPG